MPGAGMYFIFQSRPARSPLSPWTGKRTGQTDGSHRCGFSPGPENALKLVCGDGGTVLGTR